METTCCGLECCLDVAYCGTNSICSEKPVCTETATKSATRWSTIVNSITVYEAEEDEEEEEEPEFECPETSVVNDQGATLLLGDDCGLTLYPATISSSSALATVQPRSPLTANSPPELTVRRRQEPPCISTVTSTTTTYATSITVTSTSKTVATKGPEDFSCVPMSVTNAAGAELALDEECSLEYQPAGSSSGAAQITSAGNDSGGLGSTTTGGAAPGHPNSYIRLLLGAICILSFMT